MKRVGTMFFITALAAFAIPVKAQVRIMSVLHQPSARSTTPASTATLHQTSNVSPVFLPMKNGGMVPLVTTVQEADSNYTDTTDPSVGGNGWYLFGAFGDTTENIQLNTGNGTIDTTVTFYFKGLGESFTTSLKRNTAKIDSVQLTFIPRAFTQGDSLLFKVEPVWDRPTTAGDILPFIDYYGQSVNPAGYTIAQTVLTADSLTIGPGILNTVTARFGGGGKLIGNRNTFSVIAQAQGPGITGDTLEFQMEADINSLESPYTPDTTANRTYFLQLTADNNVESQGWATDIPTAADPTQAFFGNMIMIAYLHGVSNAGVDDNSQSGYRLAENFPNPISSTSEIPYNLAQSGPVSITVYNTLGEQVATVVNGTQGAGEHSATFQAGTLPNGMYYYKLQSGNFTATRTMVISR